MRPLVGRLATRGVTANQVTLAGVALSLIGGGLIAWQPFATWTLLLLPGFLLLRVALNAIDGMLAREHGQQSRLGVILDELSDVVSDAALYLPLAWVPMVWVPLIEGVVVLAVVSEMAGVVAVQVGARRQYQGPMGKSAREVGPQGSICTMVAPHPSRDLIASGHADGSVWLTRFEDDKAACIRAPAAEGVSALVWRPDGGRLAFGCEDGAAGVLNFEPAQ